MKNKALVFGTNTGWL